jgi:hypothetical protein
LTLLQVLQNRGVVALVRSAIATEQSVDAPTICIASGATIVAVSFYKRVVKPTFDALGEVIPRWIRARAAEKLDRNRQDADEDD